jgi:hypothetical protein
MNGSSTVRELAHARTGAAGPLTSTSVELTVEARADAGVAVRFSAPRERPEALERSARRSLDATLERLPGPLRPRAMVELGEVRARIRRDGVERPLFAAGYRLARCRGVVLAIEDARETGAFDSPWSGTMEASALDERLPVVLAPSAVLALVSFALEVTGGHVDERRDANVSGLTITDTSRSPYPPQHHPFTSTGEDAADRVLVDAGRWCDRAEHAGDDVDPLFYLLTRPERALRPLAAATHFNRRNLTVECGREASLPSPAVVVDSWRVRVGPRRGRVPFHAELSYLGADRERLAVVPTVALELDTWDTLLRVQGAGGATAPAVDEDPIEGDGYGTAPVLVTDLVLADLLPGTP